MGKNIATLIDELSVTNIKIFMLIDKVQKNERTKENAKKLQDLNKYRSELFNALNTSTTIKKSIATLIDELSVTNIKIFHLIEKIQKNEHTLEDAKKTQDLNKYRSELCNALNREFKQREDIKV